MKILTLCTLLLSLSAQAETVVPAPKHTEVEHHDRVASKVDARPAFNDALVAGHHDKKSSRNLAQDVDSGLALSEATSDGHHHLSVVNGGINLPKDTFVAPVRK